jgi:hypothetical protein
LLLENNFGDRDNRGELVKIEWEDLVDGGVACWCCCGDKAAKLPPDSPAAPVLLSLCLALSIFCWTGEWTLDRFFGGGSFAVQTFVMGNDIGCSFFVY